MFRRFALLPAAIFLLTAQPAPPPTWQEFSIGPATRRIELNPGSIRQGQLRSNSISLKSLVGVATGVPAVRVLGPEWMSSDHYAVAATLAEESRLRLRTRSPDDPRVVEEFQSLLTHELVQRFHLEFHRENRRSSEFTLQPSEARPLNLRPATARERGRVTINNPALSPDTTLDARNVTFRSIASWLQNHLNQPVSVAPSLPAGSYDFHLQWKAKDQSSLLAALQQQVGVELVEETRTLEYLVVDRAERLDVPDAAAPETLPQAVAPAPDSSVTYEPAQLRRDLKVLREALEEGHPGIYRYLPKPEMDRVFDRTAAGLTHEMTALEFYRVLAPVVARIKCGHTALRPSGAIQLRLADEPLIPVDVAILGGRVYVTRDFSEGGTLAGAELLAINQVPIKGILQSMLSVVHGDGDSASAGPYQLSHGRGFARNLYLIAGLQSPFRVQYAAGGKIAETSLNGMPGKAIHNIETDRFPSPPRPGNATWRLLAGNTAGVLKIMAFDGKAEDDQPLSAFFQHVFTELREKNVPRLILDVRDNGGGEDELGRQLFSYFSAQPFRYYRDLIVNKLSFRFFQYVPNPEPLPANVQDLVKPGADKKYHFVGHPNWGTLQPGAPHFGGNVVVLMNGGSFSTTCEFLATLHNRGGATFVGEETAGGYYGNTSGAAVSVVLPNSKLTLPVQLVGYYMAIDGAAQGARGILPDHPVEYSIADLLAGADKAMETALRLSGQGPPPAER
jgi:uncharacterized protein (TIGR03435 family)